MTSNNVMTDRPKFTLPRRFPILESIHSTLATPYAASTSEPVTLGKRKRPGNASEYIPVPLPFDEEEEGGVETVEDGEEDQEDVESDDELRNDTHTENVPPGQAFSESAIWEWQAAQEHLAFTAGCKALTQTDDLDMSTWTPETYAAGMEAVATFWEPNRMRYGMVGWYGWDQGGGKQERPKKFVRIEPYGMENVRKVEEGEMEKDVEDVQEFTLDELLEDVAAIPDEEMDEMAAVPGDDDEEDDDDDNVQIGDDGVWEMGWRWKEMWCMMKVS
ncbi:hypothetical protein BC829DRAFT_379498 [Chytridium lagenaria]|nr:hypothetical protein BC829DRAFT_379498 [Chytridium lagenaria]